MIQIKTHQGTRWPGERLHPMPCNQNAVSQITFNESKTHYIACFHVSPRRLLTAAPILKTKEANQKQLTEFAIGVRPNPYENCIVVAVTAEKKVATVERLSRLFAPCSCTNRIVGTPCGR